MPHVTMMPVWSALSSDGDAGTQWIADYERTSDPWFLVSLDPGHPGGYHNYGTHPQLNPIYLRLDKAK